VLALNHARHEKLVPQSSNAIVARRSFNRRIVPSPYTAWLPRPSGENTSVLVGIVTSEDDERSSSRACEIGAGFAARGSVPARGGFPEARAGESAGMSDGRVP